jgi:hypothetical protein
MNNVTYAELREIVPDLRAMAAVEATAEVRHALTRLANRYSALGAEDRGRSTKAGLTGGDG